MNVRPAGISALLPSQGQQSLTLVLSSGNLKAYLGVALLWKLSIFPESIYTILDIAIRYKGFILYKFLLLPLISSGYFYQI